MTPEERARHFNKKQDRCVPARAGLPARALTAAAESCWAWMRMRAHPRRRIRRLRACDRRTSPSGPCPTPRRMQRRRSSCRDSTRRTAPLRCWRRTRCAVRCSAVRCGAALTPCCASQKKRSKQKPETQQPRRPFDRCLATPRCLVLRCLVLCCLVLCCFVLRGVPRAALMPWRGGRERDLGIVKQASAQQVHTLVQQSGLLGTRFSVPSGERRFL